jgi:hypothetical protein
LLSWEALRPSDLSRKLRVLTRRWPVPELCAKAPLDGVDVVTAAVSHDSDSVGLFKREARRQRAKPKSRARECGAAFRRGRFVANTRCKFSGSPLDSARPGCEQFTPRLWGALTRLWVRDGRVDRRVVRPSR